MIFKNIKPLGFKNYGSIPHLSSSKLGEGDHYIHIGQEEILTKKARDKHDTILSFEKYDGSNVGICKKNNKIYAITRSGYEAKTSPYKQHHKFSEWVYKEENMFLAMLNEGERIVGEWLIEPHGLLYNITGDPIVFFDYFDGAGKRILYNDLKAILFDFGLKVARLLSNGNPKSLNELLPILNKKTKYTESQDDPEGIVFRVERKGNVDFLAKWVRPDFEAGKYLIKENF